jgi:hypothetical protein
MVTKESLEALGLTGFPKTSGSRGIHINVRIERKWTYPEVRRAALAIARDVERRAPSIATSKWWKEERHGVFLDYNQNAKDRTVASAYSVRPLPDARVSTPLSWDELPTAEAEAFTIHTVPARFASVGDPGAGIDQAVGSLDAVLALSAEHERAGEGDAPWPPNYRKQEGEPPRVQPSKQRRATADYDTPEAEAEREKNRAAMERRFNAELERRAAAKAAGEEPPATKPTPTGRRKSNVPVIEISRAKTKAEALAGLERWKVRHPEAASALDVADVLVDGMRGRSSLWYRVRVNLTHVPEADRPPQEPLDPDYDPWAEYEWPDRAGQLERAPKRRKAAEPSGE